ncbi:MAG: single-stranded-DNA-specific exonuclease RecJ [Clostridia bacterium]|nr:single-stranded-DNA-specific exonuclease RecJ [Clostridia bacterium]
MIVTRPRLDGEQLNIVKRLAERANISETFARILYIRGIDTEEKAARFLSPGKSHFTSPFLLKGMKETVERLTAARDNGEVVVVYGDYDADGICASSIMFFALREFGIEAYPVIPERADGYGLSEKVIDAAMEEYNPDLFITVDCGISGRNEVEYIKDLGVDVIVTDHHELPEVLPDCVIINCKLPEQDYPFDSLCGAGVAFKIATALLGEKAEKYLDFAALATVADSMPLVDENRDIVYEGLKLFSGSSARECFKALIEASKAREMNSTTLAYTIAPRVNAAGRMGDARCALRLFLSDDKYEIFNLAAKLTEYNIKRQAECDELYASAKAKLREKGAYRRIILLEDGGWKNGLVGITAAKLVEEYTRPVIMFVNRNGVLHGSARSVEDVNILDAISHNKEYLTEYGGHSQAAGVSLKEEDLPAFEAAMDEYLSENYGAEVFVPKQEVEDYIEEDFTLDLARELNLLEPCGTGNRKPLFAVRTGSVTPIPLRENSPHLNISTEHIDLIYFGGAPQDALLRSSVKKTFVFEPNISSYNGRESLRGYVRTFETEIAPGKELGLELYMKNLRNLRGKGGERAEYLPQAEIKDLVKEAVKSPYGTLFVASNMKTLEQFPELKDLPLDLGAPRLKNLGNCVVLVLSGGDISGYRKIIYLDNPVYEVKRLKTAGVYVNGDIKVSDMMPKINATRAGVGEVFSAVTPFSGTAASSSAELYAALSEKVPYITRYQFVFAVEVLEELGIIKFENGKMKYDKSVRADITSSKIFTKSGGRN